MWPNPFLAFQNLGDGEKLGIQGLLDLTSSAGVYHFTVDAGIFTRKGPGGAQLLSLSW